MNLPVCLVTSFTRKHAAFSISEIMYFSASSTEAQLVKLVNGKKKRKANWSCSTLRRSCAYLSYSCTHLSPTDYRYVFNHNILDGRGGKTSAELLGEESHSVCDLASKTS